jgi:hypothetical protein
MEAEHLEHLYNEDTMESRLPTLRLLSVKLSSAGVIWAPKCFSNVTDLRIDI